MRARSVARSAEAEAAQPGQLRADRRLRAVPGVHARVGRQRRDASQALLHRTRVAAREVHAPDVAGEEDVAREERALGRQVEAGRALGVPGRVQGAQVAVGEVGERPLVDEVVGLGRRGWWEVVSAPRGEREPVGIGAVDREPRSRRFLDRRVRPDVIGMPVRVQDLDDVKPVLRTAPSSSRSPLDGSTMSASPRSSTTMYVPLSSGGTRQARMRTPRNGTVRSCARCRWRPRRRRPA